MTDSEIIKSLERCLSKRSEHNCVSCSFYETDFCYNALFIVVLNLINRQKAEIERLKEEAKGFDKFIAETDCSMKEIQAEAIKEFAERLIEERLAVILLKNKSDDYAEGYNDALCFVEEQIKDLKKEMVVRIND